MRVLNGGLRLEARDGGRGLLVLKSVSGEEVAIERSPDQLAELQSAIDALRIAAQEAADRMRAEQEAVAAAPAEPSPEPEVPPAEPDEAPSEPSEARPAESSAP